MEARHSNGAHLLPPATQNLCTTHSLSTAQGRGYQSWYAVSVGEHLQAESIPEEEETSDATGLCTHEALTQTPKESFVIPLELHQGKALSLPWG